MATNIVFKTGNPSGKLPEAKVAGTLYYTSDGKIYFDISNTERICMCDNVSTAQQATQFSVAKSIALTGGVTGSADGGTSGGWSITTKVENDSHDHTNFLKLDGTRTMTGALKLMASANSEGFATGALNLQNSNINHAHTIYFDSHTVPNVPGLYFYRDTTHVDGLYAKNGTLYFSPNKEINNASYTSHIVLTSSNYNSYAPTKSGGGASGTWGISISGKAATAGSADKITTDAGSATLPVYFLKGIPVECSSTLGVSITGNAATATKATTADSATSATSAASATKLATPRTFEVKLGQTNTSTFNGEANVTLGVAGTLPISSGGTGGTTVTNALANLDARYRWTATVKCATWSRLCYVACQARVVGAKYILNIGATRANVVYNDTFLVTAHHSSNGKIIKIAGNNYSKGYQVRLLSDSNGNNYFELYDNCNSATSSTTQTVYCNLIPISTGAITRYTTFTDGTTLPTNFTVKQTMTIDNTDIQANLSGNASTATTASKLGTATVGGTARPVYLNAGAPVACGATVGDTATPVYMSGGTITKCSADVGGTTQSVYMKGGTITPGAAYAGGTAITLNGENKSASTASFYAPTTVGNSGQVFRSKGAGVAPEWSTMYWANIAISNTSSTTTSPTFSADVKASVAANIPYTGSADKYWSSPIPKYYWHDLFSFGANGTPTIEYSTNNGSTWTTQTNTDLSKKLFIQRESQSITVLNDTYPARRWTWNSSQFHACNAYYLVIGFAYVSTQATFNLTFEYSADGSTWTTLTSVTEAKYSSTPYWFYLKNASWGSKYYVRLTMVRTSGSGTTSALSSIKLLTGRWGNQGLGSEWEKPYNWDENQNIYPRVNNTSMLGTSSNKWSKVYATTFIGDLDGKALTATKLAATKKINGTDFDGSTDITTEEWGNDRTFTIGNKSIVVDGSSDCKWTLEQILGEETIPATNLPSYVDDVLEVASYSNLPSTGEVGKIYVCLDNNETYRWSGSTYVHISSPIVIGTISGTAYDGGSGANLATTVANHTGNKQNPHDVTTSQIGAVAKSGDTMTGNLIQKNVTLNDGVNNVTAIVAYDDGDSYNYGSELVIGANGNTFLGAGESPASLRSSLSEDGSTVTNENYGRTSENLYLTSDNNIYLETNCNTIANRKCVSIDTSAKVTAPGGFVGNLTGNVSGSAATLATSRTLTIGKTGKTFDGSANVSWTLAEIGAVNVAGDTITGDLAVNGKVTVGKGISLVYDPTNECLNFVFGG